ncbi:MAG: hypothetical protein ACREBZ_07275 [Thermoplasmata archaeon]
MPAEMLSGPDLGGGYLHQLTLDATKSPNVFTYHAQTGGADANGPPLGPLEPLDFRHPNSPCAFGGPRCWHREFELPMTYQGRVRQAYNRFRFVLVTQLEQIYGSHRPTVADALAEVAGRLGEASLSNDERLWYVGGSTAAWLQGADLEPNDIDLGTNRDGVDRIGGALTEYLIEPIGPTTWGGDRAVYAGRAFVGSMKDGAKVEWASDRRSRSDPLDLEWSGDVRHLALTSVEYRGHRVLATRPEYALVRALEHADGERVDRITAAIEHAGVDRTLLEHLLTRSAAPAAAQERLRTRLEGAPSSTAELGS